MFLLPKQPSTIPAICPDDRPFLVVDEGTRGTLELLVTVAVAVDAMVESSDTAKYELLDFTRY